MCFVVKNGNYFDFCCLRATTPLTSNSLNDLHLEEKIDMQFLSARHISCHCLNQIKLTVVSLTDWVISQKR